MLFDVRVEFAIETDEYNQVEAMESAVERLVEKMLEGESDFPDVRSVTVKEFDNQASDET